VAGAVLPLALTGVLAGPSIVVFIFGAGFTAGGPIFQILSVSYAGLALAWFLGHSLLAADRQADFFPPLLMAAVVAVAGGLVLIPRLEGVGAALGMLAGHLVLLVMLSVVCRAWFDRTLWRPAGAVAAGLLAQLGIHLLLTRFTGSGGIPLVAAAVGLGTGYLVSVPALWRWRCGFLDGGA